MPITMRDCRMVELLTVRVPNADFARSVDGDVAAFGWRKKSGYECRWRGSLAGIAGSDCVFACAWPRGRSPRPGGSPSRPGPPGSLGHPPGIRTAISSRPGSAAPGGHLSPGVVDGERPADGAGVVGGRRPGGVLALVQLGEHGVRPFVRWRAAPRPALAQVSAEGAWYRMTQVSSPGTAMAPRNQLAVSVLSSRHRRAGPKGARSLSPASRLSGIDGDPHVGELITVES